MKLSKVTRKLTLFLLPVVISSSVTLPISAYAQRNPVKPVSREQVISKLIDTVCGQYPKKSDKYGACLQLTFITISRANKLNISAARFNFNNASQSQKFVLQTINKLSRDNVFVSVLKTSSRNLTIQERTGIVGNSILNYGRLKQIGFY